MSTEAPKNEGKNLTELFSDLIKQMSENNDYLLKVSEKALKQHRKTKKTLEYLENIRTIMESKDILYIDEIKALREEVYRISQENVDARRELEKLKQESQLQEEACIDCFPNEEKVITAISSEEEEFFNTIIEDLTDKVNNREISSSEYHQYVSLLSHSDLEVRHRVAMELGYSYSTPSIEETDLSLLPENATPSEEEHPLVFEMVDEETDDKD